MRTRRWESDGLGSLCISNLPSVKKGDKTNYPPFQGALEHFLRRGNRNIADLLLLWHSQSQGDLQERYTIRKAECYYSTALIWGQIGLAPSCIYTNWQITFKISSIFQTYLLVVFTVRVHWSLGNPYTLEWQRSVQKVIRDGLNHFNKIKRYLNLHPSKPTALGVLKNYPALFSL